MIRRTIVGAVLATALMAASAASAASAITDDQLATLKVGVTTYRDVIAQFGRPMTVESSSDGSRTVTYAVTKTHVKAATFIPIVGLFAGGANGDVTTDRFDFGPDGTLTKTWSSATHVECGIWGGCGSGNGPSLPGPQSVAARNVSPAAPAAAPGGVTPVLVAVDDAKASRPSETATAPSAGALSQGPASAQAASPASSQKPCGMVPQPNGAVKLVPCH